MCLVVFALDAAPRYPLVFAANRDERHARPSRPASWWPDRPGVFGGRDVAAHGTWLAVDRTGRVAAVTNVRDADAAPAPRSRGSLVVDYLSGTDPAEEFAAAAHARGSHYGPFSLLLFEGGEVRYASNRAPPARLGRGVHAVSNAPLGVHWPKTHAAERGVRQLLGHDDPIDALFELLARRSDASAAEERYRSGLFIEGAVYGTRSSTVILIDATGTLTFVERSFDAAGRQIDEVHERIVMRPAERGALSPP
jgi:uncharacterized protein with NRDE domain